MARSTALSLIFHAMVLLAGAIGDRCTYASFQSHDFEADAAGAPESIAQKNQATADGIQRYKYLKTRLLDILKRQNSTLARFQELSRQEDQIACGPHAAGQQDACSASYQYQARTQWEAAASTNRRNFHAIAERLSMLLQTNTNVHARLNQPLRIIVVGQVSHGKSLLVNGLLKQQILPSTLGPVSRFSVVIQGSDESTPYASIDEEDVERKSLDMEQLASLLDGQGLSMWITVDIFS